MDWLGPVATALIAKLDPVSLILLIIVGFCGYFHVVWRKEDREDKEKMRQLLDKQIDATNGLRAVLSAITGKAQ
jgi:F0F1-type ATP synthase assembly protein I